MRPSPFSILEQVQSQPLRYGLVLILVTLSSLTFIWEVGRTPRHLPPSWSDDAHYLDQAKSLSSGAWLGDFNAKTLEERPGYSIFLARSAELGIGERGAICALQILGGLLFMLLLLRMRVAPEFALLSFGLTLMTPALFGNLAARLVPERLHAVLALILVAGLFHLAVSRRRFQAVLISVFLGLVLALDALTTADWCWLLGFVMAAFLLAAYRDWRLGHRPGLIAIRTAVVAALLFLPTVVAIRMVENLNAERYGIRALSDADETQFNRALGAFERVAQAQPSKRLDRTTRAQLYELSPSFKRLAPAFESPLFSGPIDGHDDSGRLKALRRKTAREAASRLGLYNHPETAIAFWAELADEVNLAVESGKIDGAKSILESDRSTFGLPSLGLSLMRLRELWNLEFEDVRVGDPLPRIEALPREFADAEGILGPFPWREDFLLSAAKRRALLELYRQALPTLFVLAGIGTLMTLLSRKRETWRSRHYVEFAMIAGSMVVLMMLCHRETTWLIDRGRGFLPLHLLAPFYLALGFQHHLEAAALKLNEGLKERCQRIGFGLIFLLLLALVVCPQLVSERKNLGEVTTLGEGFIAILQDATVETSHPLVLLEHDAAFLNIRPRKDPQAREARCLVLALDADQPESGSPIEISWTGSIRDERGNNKRRLFLRPGPNVWRLAVSPGQLGDLSIRASEEAPLRLQVTSLRFEELGRPYALADDPLPELSFSKRGEILTVEVKAGERESRYEFYFSKEVLESPRRYPEREGSLWLSTAAGLHESDGSDYRMLVLTDAHGNGTASRRYEAQEAFSPDIMTQALGTQHFSARPVPLKILD